MLYFDASVCAIIGRLIINDLCLQQVTRQPTDIVVKIPKPDPQFQQQTRHQPQQQYIQVRLGH